MTQNGCVAARVDISIDQGADYYLNLTCVDSNNNAVDLTGWTFQGQVRKTFDDADVLAAFEFNTGASPKNGCLTCHIPSADTADIPVNPSTTAVDSPTECAYDVFATRTDGSILRLVFGIARVFPEVTQ